MAKLSAHGTEIGRLHYTTHSKAFFSDNQILKNSGDGWKLHAKLKTGGNMLEYFNKKKAELNVWNITNREAHEYKKMLHSLTSMTNRWKLAYTISSMPEDCDGVWSECCDGYQDNVHADFNEIAELCQLYLLIPKKELQAA